VERSGVLEGRNPSRADPGGREAHTLSSPHLRRIEALLFVHSFIHSFVRSFSSVRSHARTYRASPLISIYSWKKNRSRSTSNRESDSDTSCRETPVGCVFFSFFSFLLGATFFVPSFFGKIQFENDSHCLSQITALIDWVRDVKKITLCHRILMYSTDLIISFFFL